MRLQIKWRDGLDYDHGTGPSGLRVRRALKTKSARRAEELRTDLENKLWRGNLYGVDVADALLALVRQLVPNTTEPAHDASSKGLFEAVLDSKF